MLRGGRNLSSLDRVPREAPGSGAARPHLRPRLLVVDDEQAIREWLRRALDVLGYETVDARDAPAALQVLQTSNIDGVILDLRLIGHSGIEVLEYVRYHRRLSRMPVIVLTGVSFLSEKEQEAIARLQAYILYKPEAVDQIASLLTRIIQPRIPPLP
jgi:CheY-like chemotaxis protein